MSEILRNRTQMVLGSIGIFVAGYLSLTTWLGLDAACGKDGGCKKIAASAYASIGPVAVAYLGLLAYLTLFGIAFAKTLSGDPQGKLNRIGLLMSATGFGFSAYLMYAGFFVVQETCWWCVASAITMTLTFASYLLPVKSSEKTSHFSPAWTGVPLVASLLGLIVMLNSTDKGIPPLEGYTIEQLTPANPNRFGSPDAEVTIVEFYDITCPHCRSSYEGLKKLITDGGKLNIVMRHFPLRSPGHEMGLPAAVFSEMAAEKGKYFQFVEAAFERQAEVANPTKGVATMLGILESLGIPRDEASRRALDETDPAFNRVHEDIRETDRLGLSETPTFYIGLPGKQVYPAKMSSVRKVLDRPDLRRHWDTKAP